MCVCGCCRGADRGEGRVFGVGMQAQQGSQRRQEGCGGETHINAHAKRTHSSAHTKDVHIKHTHITPTHIKHALIDTHKGIGLRASASCRAFTVLRKPVRPLEKWSPDVLCAVLCSLCCEKVMGLLHLDGVEQQIKSDTAGTRGR